MRLAPRLTGLKERLLVANAERNVACFKTVMAQSRILDDATKKALSAFADDAPAHIGAFLRLIEHESPARREALCSVVGIAISHCQMMSQIQGRYEEGMRKAHFDIVHKDQSSRGGKNPAKSVAADERWRNAARKLWIHREDYPTQDGFAVFIKEKVPTAPGIAQIILFISAEERAA
jgi:hypothetical protein